MDGFIDKLAEFLRSLFPDDQRTAGGQARSGEETRFRDPKLKDWLDLHIPALIGPRVGGVPFTHSWIRTLSDMAGITVLAVNMPNIAGVRGDAPSKYFTTIGKIEDATGLNFLSLLDESIQCKIEVRDCLPVSHIVSASGSTTVAAGTQFVLNTGAVDADGADGPWKLSIDWGDGTTYAASLFALPTDAHPLARGKTWTTSGTYTVRVSITDKRGGTSVSSIVVTVTP